MAVFLRIYYKHSDDVYRIEKPEYKKFYKNLFMSSLYFVSLFTRMVISTSENNKAD